MRGRKKYTFRMEYPDLSANKRQQIKIFDGKNDLIVKAENNKLVLNRIF